MNSLQYYIDKYHGLADGLGITGDTAEVLCQFLGNATYISEVEHVVYNQEASLEKAVLMNSKIQHCMEDMYSVFRGQCPRVIIKFKPTTYLEFNLFDEIYVGSNFKVAYIGYLGESSGAVDSKLSEESLLDGFVYSSVSIPPATEDEDIYTILGLIYPSAVSMTATTNSSNPYYIESLEEDLSEDLWIKDIDGNYIGITREFSRHLVEGLYYDLTLPSFGSRIYLSTPTINSTLEVYWYKYSLIDSYNINELRKISIRGAQLVSFGEDTEYLGISESSIGIILIPESSRDTLPTIHYRANKDRYMNSILRVNQDIGTLLEEAYPEIIRTSGTSWIFDSTEISSSLKIYYIPKVSTVLLTPEQISEYIENRSAYYVTKNIEIKAGTQYIANLRISLELFQSDAELTQRISEILNEYSYKFNINLKEKEEEIRSLISKISTVKQILDFSISYVDQSGNVLNESEINSLLSSLESKYFKIETTLSTVIQTKLL